MNPTDLVSLQRRVTEAIDHQDWAGALALVSPDVRVRMGGQSMDRAGWVAQGQGFYAAFPDGTHVVQDTLVDGDRVAIRGVWRGTHRGDFMGIPATGRPVAIDVVLVDRFVDGLLVERNGLFDAMALMQQLGAMG